MSIACRGPRLIAVAIVLLSSLVVTSLSAEPRHVTTVEGISEYQLDNGLTVLLMPDASRPTSTINVTYKVGSRHESIGETGMAHLLEHMVFYGTPDHQDIKAEISERGGVANGTTWYDRTNYFQTLPAGEENLEWAIRMEADRMVNSLIDEDDLASEMTVVRNEFEIGENSPVGVLLQRVMATAYLWHGYGRSTIGARSDIENVPIERLQAFYRRYYQPDNAIVIVSGNFDPENALALIETHFGAIPRPERTGEMRLWPSYTRDPVQDGQREVTVRRSGEVQALIGAWHIPSARHEDFAALSVLSHILGDMPSGRLHKALVETELATQVGTFSFALGEPSLMMTYVQVPKEQDIDSAQVGMLEAVDQLADNPPDEDEVQRAINSLTNGIERTLNDSNRVGIQLSEWAAAGDWRLMFLHRDRIEQVSTDDVARVAATYLKRDNRTLGRFIPDADPQRSEIPDAPELGPLLADYTGRDDRAAGEAFDPTPDNIAERLIEFELANGTRVALLPKQTRGEKVVGNVTLRMGSLDSLSDLGEIPGTVSSMLMRGSENHSRQEISDRVDELRSSLSIGGSKLVSVRLSSEREHLSELLDLTADVLKHPAFPEDEFNELTRQLLASLDQSRDQPFAVANRQLDRHLQDHGPGHPDYTPSFDEQAERYQAMEISDLRQFHASHFGLGPQATISFVGDFDPDELRATLETHFGDWTSDLEFERIPSEITDAEPQALESQLDDKANATLLANYVFPMRDDHPDYPALVLAGHLIGGGFLNSRLADRIRDEEGLSYGVGGGISASAIDEYGTFFAYAMFAPENREALVEVLFEELEKVVESGFEADEMQAGRRGFLQQLEVGRANDEQLAGQLANNRYLDRDIYHQARFEQAIEGLTLDELNAAVRRHFDPSRISYALAGDFDDDE